MIAPFFKKKHAAQILNYYFLSTIDCKYLRLFLSLNHVFIYNIHFHKFTKIIKEVFIPKQSLKSFLFIF